MFRFNAMFSRVCRDSGELDLWFGAAVTIFQGVRREFPGIIITGIAENCLGRVARYYNRPDITECFRKVIDGNAIATPGVIVGNIAFDIIKFHLRLSEGNFFPTVVNLCVSSAITVAIVRKLSVFNAQRNEAQRRTELSDV